MKNILRLLVITVILSSSLFAGETVKLAIGDWAPFTSENDKNGKLLEKIVTEAFKLEGVEVKYEYYPWKRSYDNTLKGESDGTFPWSKTDDREKEFIINKEVLVKDDGVYFHLKSKAFDWNTLDDLKKYKIGVTIGYKDEQIYKEKGIPAETVANEDLNFKKIKEGRIDVYQTSKIVGYSTIKKLFSPEEAKLFTNHPKVAQVNDYYILFSKKSPNGKMFSEKFDIGLGKLKKNGTYDKIISEFLGTSSR